MVSRLVLELIKRQGCTLGRSGRIISLCLYVAGWPVAIYSREKGRTLTQAVDVVQRYHQAWTSGDVEGALAYIAEDIHCAVPGKEIIGKEPYREFLHDFVADVTTVVDIAQLVEGKQVALFYYPQTTTTKDAATGEYFVVEDDKITKTIVVYDRESF